MKIGVVLIILTFILISGTITYIIIKNSLSKDLVKNKEFNCIDSESYKYDSEIGACISSGGISAEQRKAANIVVEFLSGNESSNLTIVSIENAECPSCFNFALESPTYKYIFVKTNNSGVADLTVLSNDIVFVK